MGAMLLGFNDVGGEYTPKGIKNGLERAGFYHNLVYNRMLNRRDGTSTSTPNMEYFPGQAVVAVYAYPEEVDTKIPATVEIVRNALPGFQPKLAGIGSCEENGAKVKWSSASPELEEQVARLLR